MVVRFSPERRVRSVRSLRKAGYFHGHLHEQEKGELQVRRDNGSAWVQLNLAICDYLLVE